MSGLMVLTPKGEEMRYFMRAWVIASTFYTIYDVTVRLSGLYPDKTNLVMVAGIVINIVMNTFILNALFGDEEQ
ncbi:hypothetical protein ACUXI4_004515 [Pantoea piersonii]|jgi:hypothetical protein